MLCGLAHPEDLPARTERDAPAGTYPSSLVMSDVAPFLRPPHTSLVLFQRYYEFTQEEMKALEECDRESFYQRCMPLSTLFATVTYAAIRCGKTHEFLYSNYKNTIIDERKVGRDATKIFIEVRILICLS